MDTKLKKDFLEAEENIQKISKKLKNERISLIKRKFNLNNFVTPESPAKINFNKNGERDDDDVLIKSINDINSSFVPLNQNYVNQNDFDKILIDNKNKTIWPSRRIDELQNYYIQKQ